jgi:hypothetical protein
MEARSPPDASSFSNCLMAIIKVVRTKKIFIKGYALDERRLAVLPGHLPLLKVLELVNLLGFKLQHTALASGHQLPQMLNLDMV